MKPAEGLDDVAGGRRRPRGPWPRISRVVAMLRASRSRVVTSSTVGKAVKSSGFSMNSAVIRISTETVIESASSEVQQRARQRQDQQDEDRR